ncbi:HAMP domain-containing histidine kinase [Cytobacillus sp. Sa5YUA1]|uniref:histidine kinase n=1 Tax=Cytobacillus stercorigallinarum TaxID=2762240 RepID=A0ABR8QSC2_9BACI|nr:HAMP domain-containing histidine kinase [Cytobacillus stercorigallinarum]
MKNLSVKLGLLFFLIIFTLELFLFFFLHSSLVESRVEEELFSLQSRGDAHKDTLRTSFEADTIQHVALMEREASTDVIVTNLKGSVLASSLSLDMKKIISSGMKLQNGVVENDWENQPYIVTVSSIPNQGYVFMFQNTNSIQTLIDRLNNHFFITGLITAFLTIVIIILLSIALVRPLNKMKEATIQIKSGDFSISLPDIGNDELGKLAKTINLLASELKHLKQERSQFLANISHELKTPLTYLKGYADIVQRKELPIEEREKYLSIIQEEAKRINTLVEDLFELAKIDQYGFKMKKQPIHLSDFLAHLHHKFEPAFHHQSMRLHVEMPKENIIVNIDSARVEQILYNLLDNSLKYSQTATETTLKIWTNTNDLYISIVDNGSGIQEKDLPHIFKRFYRGTYSNHSSNVGSGLGLSIVKELVNAHNGDITVKSNAKTGTTFTIMLKGAVLNEKDTFSR